MAIKFVGSITICVLSRTALSLHMDDHPTGEVAIDADGAVSELSGATAVGEWGLLEQAEVEEFRKRVAEAEIGAPLSDELIANDMANNAPLSNWFSDVRLSLRFEPMNETDDARMAVDANGTNEMIGRALGTPEPTPWKTYFERDACKKHAEEDKTSGYFAWCQGGKPIIYSHEHKFGYMKTPKAASTAFFAYFKQMFPDAKEVNHASDLPSDAYIFTFVRKPFEQKLSGFAEVDLKQGYFSEYGNRQKTHFQAIPKERNHGRDRFMAFLNDIEQRRFDHADKRMPSHAASQISGVLCTHEVKFIGHLEQATVDWARIQEEAKLPSNKRTQAVPIVHEGTSESYKFDEQIPLTKDMELKICSMFPSDFACLGYTAPESCERFDLK